MTDLELISAFVAWRADTDSEPFAHEADSLAVTAELLTGERAA